MKTSVIIPVYNTAQYLKDCLDSLLSQTMQDMEIIIVDDGSTDGSIELCRAYANRYPFIRLILQDHQFQGTARNRGLQEAHGEYVYFMDSDDMIRPELFEKAYQACEKENLDFVMFDAHGFQDDPNDTDLFIPDDIFDRTTLNIEDRIYTGPEFWNTFYKKHGVLYVCWLLYIRREYLLKNNITYEEKTYFEDNDWIVRMYMYAERTRYLPLQLHEHRYRRGSNMLSGFIPDLLKGCFRMHDVLLKIYENTPGEEKQRMLHEVIRLNTCRYERLQEVPPTDDYILPLQEYCRKLHTELTDPHLQPYRRITILEEAARLRRAENRWQQEDPTVQITSEAFRRDLKQALQNALHIGIPHTRTAVIITKRPWKHYISLCEELLGEEFGEYTLLSKKPEEAASDGRPVLSLDNIVPGQFDTILEADFTQNNSILPVLKTQAGEHTAVHFILH